MVYSSNISWTINLRNDPKKDNGTHEESLSLRNQDKVVKK